MATKKPAQQDQSTDEQAQTTADAQSPALEPEVAALRERTEADRLEQAAALAISREAIPAGVVNPRPTLARIVFEDMSTSRGGEPLPTVISGTMSMRINGQNHHATFEASGVIAPGVYEILAKVTPF